AVTLPITGLLPAAPRLPAVHDLALVAERVRLEHRVFRLDQVLPLGEQLVVGVDHAAAERPPGQVRPGLAVLFIRHGLPTVLPRRLVTALVHARPIASASRSRAISRPT